MCELSRSLIAKSAVMDEKHQTCWMVMGNWISGICVWMYCDNEETSIGCRTGDVVVMLGYSLGDVGNNNGLFCDATD